MDVLTCDVKNDEGSWTGSHFYKLISTITQSIIEIFTPRFQQSIAQTERYIRTGKGLEIWFL